MKKAGLATGFSTAKPSYFSVGSQGSRAASTELGIGSRTAAGAAASAGLAASAAGTAGRSQGPTATRPEQQPGQAAVPRFLLATGRNSDGGEGRRGGENASWSISL